MGERKEPVVAAAEIYEPGIEEKIESVLLAVYHHSKRGYSFFVPYF
jgi:hypothetical protein